MKKYHIVLIISVIYALLSALSVIPKEGYGGFFNEIMTFAGIWYLGAWFQAALANAEREEEEEYNDL
jgi:hypothetical protein